MLKIEILRCSNVIMRNSNVCTETHVCFVGFDVSDINFLTFIAVAHYSYHCYSLSLFPLLSLSPSSTQLCLIIWFILEYSFFVHVGINERTIHLVWIWSCSRQYRVLFVWAALCVKIVFLHFRFCFSCATTRFLFYFTLVSRWMNNIWWVLCGEMRANCF